jgi:tetratricopeptide (TPR) repeat protein
MGVTSVSFMPDASIQYYNPSVMSSLQWKQFAFSRMTLFESNSVYHTLSYSQPLLDQGTIGLSVLRTDVGGIEERDQTNQLLSSDLHNSQTRVLLGYGRNIGSTFAAGFNVVFDNQAFAGFSGSGVGLDVGLSAQQNFSGRSMIKGIREGFAIRNVIEPSVKLDQEKVADPMDVGLGLSVLSVVGNMRMVTTMNLVNPRYSPVSLRVGQEFTYADHYSLRVGVDDATPTFGAGADYKNFTLDYAYRSENFGDNHRFSLGIRFGSSLGEQRAQARQRREQEINETIGNRMDELENAQIARSLEEGKRLMEARDFEEALSRFEITLLWDPENEEAKQLATTARYKLAMRQGKDAMADDDYAGALIHLKKALRYVPGDSEATELINACNRRVAAEVNSAATVSRLLKTAIDLYADRRFGDALSGFDEVLRIDPRNPLAIEYRKKCEINIRGEIQRLVVDARALASNDDYEGAIRLLEQALAYDPQDAGVIVEIDRYKKALADQKAAAKPEPEPVATKPTPQPTVNRPALERKYNEGIKSFNSGDFNQAIRSLSDIWTQDPNFHKVSSLLVKAYLFVGMNYYADQNYAEAIRLWERALTVDPNNSKTKRYLSKANEEVRKLGGVSNAR